MPTDLKIGQNIFTDNASNPELFKIDIITENITTNPPIITIVWMAFIILLAKTSPKLENVKVVVVEELIFLGEIISLSSYFQNLNKSPTKTHEIKWVKNSNNPNSCITK